MSTLFPTQGHHVVYMCPDVIFQILLLCSRPMTSHHVICHVTAMSCASSSSLKEKEKEIQKKRNIKSRKIDKGKRKILVSRVRILINSWLIYLVNLLTHLMLIRLQDLILIQGELKPAFLTSSAILSLTSSIIFCFNVTYIFMLTWHNLTWTLWKSTLQ